MPKFKFENNPIIPMYDLNGIIRTLSKNNNIIFAYIFGSQVNNKIRFGSDLDIGIYFKIEPDILYIGDLYNQIEKYADVKIDIVMLNNLYLKNPGLAYNILKQGTILINKDIRLLAKYKKNVILEYLNSKPMLDLFHLFIISH